ncbi:Glucose-6-phosphate phosphate translocator [Musa troglodytarum]|uniref:Glucose-6-phosphate phosphate translocator n=1 Tax=Musa troglodytarum TaxID=320322 RepID=A0A9E7FAS1_9LILI|nr:Glucose-6-phosphate phosphate translocator [Musa troglodytarum]URD90411.1 Glucose-6-phosphate phosphate translocator [Musa troglodytarum]
MSKVAASRFLLGERFPVSVYLSLVPIIGGCALAAATELNFSMTGFFGCNDIKPCICVGKFSLREK